MGSLTSLNRGPLRRVGTHVPLHPLYLGRTRGLPGSLVCLAKDNSSSVFRVEQYHHFSQWYPWKGHTGLVPVLFDRLC